MNTVSHRVLAVLVAFFQIAPTASSDCVEVRRNSGTSCVIAWQHVALALPSSLTVDPLSAAKRLISSAPEVKACWLPRYTGGGETSIHKAIRHAERLLTEGDDFGAINMLFELDTDLETIHKASDIEGVMAKWNARYPAQLQVDIIINDVAPLRSYVQKVFDHATSGFRGDEVLETWRNTTARVLHDVMQAHQYETADELLADAIDAQAQKTSFEITIPASLAARLERPSPLRIEITGMPTVSRLFAQLHTEYAVLDETEWQLKIDGKLFRAVDQLILPGLHLELSPPESPNVGPSSQTVWSLIPFTLFAWNEHPWVQIVGTIIAIGVFGRLAMRARFRPLRSHPSEVVRSA